MLGIVKEKATLQVREELAGPSSSLHAFSESVLKKAGDAWQVLCEKASNMSPAELGLYDHMAGQKDALLSELRILSKDPVANESMASIIKAEVAHQFTKKAKLSKEGFAAIEGHLHNLLPPLLRGFVAMFAEHDFQKFVSALRFVHKLVTTQKKLFESVFGKEVLDNFEKCAPLFHVLDLIYRQTSFRQPYSACWRKKRC